MGVLCRTYPGPHGQNIEEEEEVTISMTAGVYDAIMRNAIKMGVNQSELDSKLQSPARADAIGKSKLEEGNKEIKSNSDSRDIPTEDKRQYFMDKMIEGLREEGALAVWVEIVAEPV